MSFYLVIMFYGIGMSIMNLSLEDVSSISSRKDLEDVFKKFKVQSTEMLGEIYECDDHERLSALYKSLSTYEIPLSTPTSEKNFEKIVEMINNRDVSSELIRVLGQNLSNVGFEVTRDSLEHGKHSNTLKTHMKEGNIPKELNEKKVAIIKKIQAVFMEIAKEMDPKERAGETKESNHKDAATKGRETHSGSGDFLRGLVKVAKLVMALHDISDLADIALNPEKSHETLKGVVKETAKKGFEDTLHKREKNEKSYGMMR